MKSMVPQGGTVSTREYRLCQDTENLVNGNHQDSPTRSLSTPGERIQSEHSAIVSSIEKDLQDIMDSLVMDDPQPPSTEGTKTPRGQLVSHSSLSPMVNGGGRCLLSPPTSPGAMSVGSSYENTSPPFSPLSSPSAASSGSFTSPSSSGGVLDQSCSLPPVPVRSSSYSFMTQPLPVPQTRTVLPKLSSGGWGQKVQESPRLHHKVLVEAPPSPKPNRRGLGQDGSESPRQTSLLSSAESLSSRNIIPGSPRLTSKFPTCPSSLPSSPRAKNTVLQERPASPFREQASLTDGSQTTNHSRQSTRAFQPPLDPIVHIIQGSPLQQHSLLQPPGSPRMTRGNMELNGGSGVAGNCMRELPPLSPSVTRKVLPGALPGASSLRILDSPSSLSKFVPESPKFRRKSGSVSEELPTLSRGIRARSPSPTSLEGGSGVGVRKASFGNSLSPAYSMGSLPGSSPVASPRTHRKMSTGRPFPGMRERKNSITEINDNENELLEYHRCQREERLREQEMERLERQRLETILNLCAEYNKGEDTSLETLGPDRTGFPGGLTDGLGRRPSMEKVLGGMLSSSSLRLLQRQRESDEENLKEECSSTESTHQEHEDSSSSSSPTRVELGYLEDQQVCVLAHIDELKNRLMEVEQQLQESKQEAEMELALLQGERHAELDQIEAATDVIAQLQHKLEELESATQREKDKERANVEAERRALQSLQEDYAELKNQLHNCPECLREQLQEQLKKDGEAVEAATKKFEDLEFQQLERESSLEEERETLSQQLLQEKTEYHNSVSRRKAKVSALDNQTNQLSKQASQDYERLTKDRSLNLQMLQKEKERLLTLEKRYQSLTGGKTFPKASTAMREVFRSKLDSDPGLPLHQLKLGSVPSLQHGASTLGRNASSKSLLPANSTYSLPRNLAATLQDIETKRQLALQQTGQQVIEEQRRRLAELKQRAAAEAQCHWEALHGSQIHLMNSSSPLPPYSPVKTCSPALSHGSVVPPTLVHHSILHHHPTSAGEQPYDTLSLESSDSVDTSVSTGNNSACSPDNMSSVGGVEALKIEEMEKMLKEAQLEKARLIESRVGSISDD
ncbi:uncharacterized protein V6R79_021865 [Siganus canaliculatus]